MIYNSHSSWVLSLNLIDAFLSFSLSATADEYNVQNSRSPLGAQDDNIYKHTSLSILRTDFNLSLLFSAYTLHLSSSALGPVQPLLESTLSAQNLLGNGPKSTGILRLKKLNKITHWNQGGLYKGGLYRRALYNQASISETLKGKFTEWLKGWYPPFPPISMSHYGLYSIPHDG